MLTESWPPYNYIDDFGDLTGSATLRVRKLLKTQGIPHEIKLLPWKRAYQIALSQPNVLIYTLIRSPEREKLFHWFCPIAEPEAHYLYKLKGNNKVKVNSLQDARQYSVAVIENSFTYQRLKDLGFNDSQLDASAYHEVNVKKFLNGRTDLIILTQPSMKIQFKKVGVPRSKLEVAWLVAEIDKEKVCMGLSQGSSPHLIEQLAQAFPPS